MKRNHGVIQQAIRDVVNLWNCMDIAGASVPRAFLTVGPREFLRTTYYVVRTETTDRDPWFA